jgi:hypothetical protein
MSLRTLKRTSSRAPGAFLALLSVLACAPGSVQAGCNNHVRTADGVELLGMDSLSALIVGSLDESPNPSSPRGVPPCSGPSCREGSRTPFGTPSVASARHPKLWCNTAVAPPDDHPAQSTPQAERTSLYRLRRSTDIDRPPRPRPA